MPKAWLLPVPPSPFRSDVLEELGYAGGGPACIFLEAYDGPSLPGLAQLRDGALICAPLEELARTAERLSQPWQEAALQALRPVRSSLRLRRGLLPLGERTYVMGILNLTPDSFSDGGSYPDVDAAVHQAQRLIADGADILDIGGESTRPGAQAVPLDEELRRVVPVLKALQGRIDVPISIDTYKWPVAQEALRLGAEIVNDITAGRTDPVMLGGCAAAGAAVVLMHTQEEARYARVGDEIRRHLSERAAAARAAGIAEDAIVLDPGIGFGKEPDHSYAALRMLPSLRALGHPVLLGPSRKRFLGAATGRPTQERGNATVAAVALSVAMGADIVRVHEVGPAVDAARVADRTVRG
ncbi:MAG: dihydropteroate synthase [Thermaerobacter sp.]|nr:dihydropteroate synthase [Thermaerobacter sp.]